MAASIFIASMVATWSPTATVEVDHVAGGVRQDLHLDLPGLLDGLLQVDAGVAERGVRLAHGGSRAASSTRRMPRPPPPATAFTKTG